MVFIFGMFYYILKVLSVSVLFWLSSLLPSVTCIYVSSVCCHSTFQSLSRWAKSLPSYSHALLYRNTKLMTKLPMKYSIESDKTQNPVS